MSQSIPEVIRILGASVKDAMTMSLLRDETQSVVSTSYTDRLYVDCKPAGLSIIATPDGECSLAVQLYSTGFQDHCQFKGDMPWGLSFEMSRQDMMHRFGKPSASGGGVKVPVFGTAPCWDRFDEPPLSIHVRYSPDLSSVILISVMLTSFALQIT